MRQGLGVSERRACRVLGQHRSTQRKVPQGRSDEEQLTEDIIILAREYGRYGYRIVTGLLRKPADHQQWHRAGGRGLGQAAVDLRGELF